MSFPGEYSCRDMHFSNPPEIIEHPVFHMFINIYIALTQLLNFSIYNIVVIIDALVMMIVLRSYRMVIVQWWKKFCSLFKKNLPNNRIFFSVNSNVNLR
jgi:hypothetical protein